MKIAIFFLLAIHLSFVEGCTNLLSSTSSDNTVYYKFVPPTDPAVIKTAKELSYRVVVIEFSENLFGDGVKLRKDRVGKFRDHKSDVVLQFVAKEDLFNHAIINLYDEKLTILTDADDNERQMIINRCLELLRKEFQIKLIHAQDQLTAKLVFLYKFPAFTYNWISLKPIL